MKFYYQNIRGGNTFSRIIRNNMLLCYYDIIFLVETWFQAGVFSAEIAPNDKFEVFRRDRDLSATGRESGGGIFIAARKGLKITRRQDLESSEVEMIWLVLQSDYPIYICCVYLPNRLAYADYFKLFKNVQDAAAVMESTA